MPTKKGVNKTGGKGAYAAAGVDIDAQDKALAQVKKLARGTFTEGVLTDIGSFGGLFRPDLRGLSEPVLVASADGVGTKLAVAKMAGDYTTVGRDLVNHCVNDILVQGAEPLFFMDYVGAGVLEPERMVDLLRGVADGCKANGCALLGGETAEMPGFYQPGDYELVGFIVGLADRSRILDGSRVRPKDLLIGLPSAGLHTNGYSLARKVLFETLGLGLDDKLPGAACTVGQELLKPHLSYLDVLRPLLGNEDVHAFVHITGGGLTDNLPRVLPKDTHAKIRVGAWEVPPLFPLLQLNGNVEREEMFQVFNMGIGMVIVVAPEGVSAVLQHLRSVGQKSYLIGSVQPGRQKKQPAVVYDFIPEELDPEIQAALARGEGG